MYKCINGFTKEKMIQVINDNMLDHKSVDKTKCLYRAPDGNKCAVGCFIPDSVYVSSFENKFVGYIYIHIEKYMPLSVCAMHHLQFVHD